MKRDLSLAVLLAVLIAGWWLFASTDVAELGAMAGTEPPAVLNAGTAGTDPAATDASTAAPSAARPDTVEDNGDGADGMATEAEFLEFATACKARIGSDPFYSRFIDEYPACVPNDRLIKRYNELHVLPYHPVVAENCFEHYSSDEDMTPGERCTLRPRETYSGASKAQLLEWVEAGDATAASLLVEFPTASPQERFDAALAAYRLSGKPAELVRYVEKYSVEPILKVDLETRSAKVDHEPSAIVALNAYILSSLAKVDGDQRANPEQWKAKFARHAEMLASEGFDAEATQRAIEALVAARLGEGAGDA